MRGDVIAASGPWRSSGEWWQEDGWDFDEWDLAIDFGKRAEPREKKPDDIVARMHADRERRLESQRENEDSGAESLAAAWCVSDFLRFAAEELVCAGILRLEVSLHGGENVVLTACLGALKGRPYKIQCTSSFTRDRHSVFSKELRYPRKWSRLALSAEWARWRCSIATAFLARRVFITLR